MNKVKDPSLFVSVIPILFLIVLLIGSVLVFKDSATSGPSQVALMLGGFFAAALAFLKGTKWADMERQILHSIGIVAQAILILILVGSLIGTWILAGVVPSLIVWGLEILSPKIFLFASAVITAIISMATGSSWSTAGTMGLALIGIGNTMGIHPGISAGAIISGAYFGDKMSPFSETTNLASSMVRTDLFVHIRHMVYTTGPAMTIALVLYLIIGFTLDVKGYDPSKIELVVASIRNNFNVSLWMILPIVILFGLIAMKISAIPALIIGTITGGIFAVIFQPDAIMAFSGKETGYHYLFLSIKAVFQVSANGYIGHTGLKEVDDLLTRGGMASMLNTVWIILMAMFFSGIMEGSRMLHTLANSILKLAKSTGSLVLSTILTAIFMNVLAADQYLSIVITGRMYDEAYRQRNLKPRNLSRTLEDAGTLTSPLVPWNTCGAFMSSTLGVPTIEYLPYAFLNIINPVISVIYGYTGFTIHYFQDELAENNKDTAESSK